MQQISAVLFDRDDTLAYTDHAVYREAALWMGEQFGLDPRQAGQILAQTWQEKAADWWHLRTQEDEDAFWNDYGAVLTERLGLPAEKASEVMAAFPYERYMKPVPEAAEVLSRLRAQGIRIGVLSNTLPSIDRTLEAVGLAELVDVALATCTLGVHKPEARAFTLAAEALGLPPQNILFIDDRLDNVEAARAVGMRAELIDLKGENPAAIHDLKAVLELVQA